MTFQHSPNDKQSEYEKGFRLDELFPVQCNNPKVRDDFKTTFAPIDVLNCIYAALHATTYNEKYKELLKIGIE